MLHIAAQGTGAVLRVIGRVHNGGLGRRRQLATDLLVGQTVVELGDLQVDDLGHILLGQGFVEHDLVQTVEELRSEGAAQQRANLLLGAFLNGTVGVDAVQDILRAKVGGQDQNGVLEVHGSALRIGDPAIVQHLQQDVEHVGMRLLHLVEQDDGVGLAAYRFGQLAAFLIAHVSGRRADQTGHGVFLHVFGHVDTHHVVLVVKQRLRQRLGKLGLAHARGAEEQERADGAVGVLNACAAALDGFRDGLNRFVLTDHPLVEGLVQRQQLLPLSLHQPGNGDSRPALHDLGDFPVGNSVRKHIAFLGSLSAAFFFLQLVPGFSQTAIFQLRYLRIVVVPLGNLLLTVQPRDFFPQLLYPANGVLFIFPLRSHSITGIPLLGQLFLQLGKTCLGKLVLLLLQCCFLDLHLDDLPIQRVQLCRFGIILRPDLGAGFIDQIDGLVGQEPVSDIPMGQGRGGDDGGVRDFHAVEHLVTFLQATENGDGILHRGFIHLHRLEPALQSGVLFNILAVLVQRRRTDAVQLAPSQHGFQQVARIHAALGLSCAHNGVQFIDEQDDLALGLLHLVQHGFQPFLKLAPVLGARDQRAHVQRENGLVLQLLGDILLHDSLGKPLGNGGFANAGFADENGVVLRLPGQDTNNIPDFLIPSDHRVHLLLSCPLDQIGAVLFQRVVGSLRVIGGDTLIAADFPQCFQRLAFLNLISLEQLLHATPGGVDQAKEQMLHGNIFVLHGLCLLLGRGESIFYVVAEIKGIRLTAHSHAGEFPQLGFRRRFQTFHRNAHLFQQLGDQSILLLYQRQKQMHLLHLRIGILKHQIPCVLNGFSGFLGTVF